MEQNPSRQTAIGRLAGSIGRGVRRFSVPFGFAAAITLIHLLYGTSGGFLLLETDSFPMCAWFALGTGMALSAALELLLEARQVRLRKLWEILISVPVSVGLLVWVYLGAKGKLSTQWETLSTMVTAGIALASILIGLSAVSRRGSEGSGFRAAVFGAFWGWLLCAIVSSAFLLFYFAIDTLIVSLPEELILAIVAFSTMCVGLMVFLSFLPAPDEERSHVKAYSILFTYVLAPLFLVYLLILYVYLVRIAVRWTMPSGEMNPYGMCALGVFTVLWLALRGEEAPFAKWFSRFGGLLVLPVTAVQILGLVIRIRAYGLTPLRVVSLFLVLLGLIAVVMSLFRAKLSVFFLIAACFSLLMLASPANVVQIASFEQEVRLKKVLTKYSMILPDGSLSLAAAEPSDEDREQIKSGLTYFRYADGFLSPFGKAAAEKAAEEYDFGADVVNVWSYSSCSYVSDKTVPRSVPSGSRAYYLGDLTYATGEANPSWTDPLTGETLSFDLEPLLKKLVGEPPFGEDRYDEPADLSFSPDGKATVWISGMYVTAKEDNGLVRYRADAFSCWILIPEDPALH